MFHQKDKPEALWPVWAVSPGKMNRQDTGEFGGGQPKACEGDFSVSTFASQFSEMPTLLPSLMLLVTKH